MVENPELILYKAQTAPRKKQALFAIFQQFFTAKSTFFLCVCVCVWGGGGGGGGEQVPKFLVNTVFLC